MSTPVLSHGDLVDLKLADERGWNAIAKVVYSFREDNPEDLVAALGDLCDVLTVFQSKLDLDSVDVDDDEPDPIANVERITRRGGRSDG